jgi:hypothetical protein
MRLERNTGAAKGICQIFARTAFVQFSNGMFVKFTHDCFAESQNITHEQSWVKLEVEIELIEENNLESLIRISHERFAAKCRVMVPQI